MSYLESPQTADVRQNTSDRGLRALDSKLATLGYARQEGSGRIHKVQNIATGPAIAGEVRVTSSKDGWPTKATDWLHITLDPQTQVQQNLGPKTLPDANIVCILVLSVENEAARFFILKKHDLQRIAIQDYSDFMDPKKWKRPRKPDSFDCRPKPFRFEAHEGQWGLLP